MAPQDASELEREGSQALFDFPSGDNEWIGPNPPSDRVRDRRMRVGCRFIQDNEGT
jgi:hypothetical protein